MIPVKEAVSRAVSFAASILEAPRNSDLRLEEVEAAQHNGDEVWLVTLSMPDAHPFSALGGGRDYKTFTVHGKSGEVLAMKIRELASSR
jgi:hypothetical protein